MFRTLYNECIINFQLKANSPLSIRSGENSELDPLLPDNSFIRSYHNGEIGVVIPGSGIKGVFRNRSEQLLKNSCNVFDKTCFYESKNSKTITDKYKKNCPACRLFGSMSLKSRIEFSDAFPIKDTIKLSTRHNVGIDRVTGAAKRGALFEPEILESGTFDVKISLKNYFSWQLKVILQVFNDINEGYVTFGGITSRGFGKMLAENIEIKCRKYTPEDTTEFYKEKEYTFEKMLESVKSVQLSNNEMQRTDIKNESLL